MPNPRRGEIEAILDGRPYNLCLTLGALAELEASFGEDDMLALAKRFEAGRLSARDCVRIIGAGLRGCGTDLTDEDVARLQCEGGAAGYVMIVARLLRATFGTTEPASPASLTNRADAATETSRPFVVKPAPADPSPGMT